MHKVRVYGIEGRRIEADARIEHRTYGWTARRSKSDSRHFSAANYGNSMLSALRAAKEYLKTGALNM